MSLKHKIASLLVRSGIGMLKSGGASGDQFFSLTDPRLSKVVNMTLGGMQPRILSLASSVDYIKAWQDCPPLAAIIIRMALADLNGKLTFTNAKDGSPVNLDRQLTARSINKLMARPNPLQTWKQFRAQQSVYKRLFGYCPVFCIRPAGFTKPEDVRQMWNIPPQFVTIETTGKLYYQFDAGGIIKKIEVKHNGVIDTLAVEDVFFIKDQYASIQTEVLPASRLTTLAFPISNIAAAYEAANVLITRRGALGILSQDKAADVESIPMTPEDKDLLQEDWRRYGVSEDLLQIIITTAALKWQQIAMPVKDLMLFETIADSTRQICDVYGYPYELLSKEKGDTFNNKREAKKELYQDFIIPEADSDLEAYAEYFKLADAGIVMKLDFNHLDVLQESEVQRSKVWALDVATAERLYRTGGITLNRMLELLDEEKHPQGDQYYTASQSDNSQKSDEDDSSTL